MGAKLAQDCSQETYDDIGRLVYACVQQFIKRHNGRWDREELVSVAHVWYMRAVTTYRMGAGTKFSTWVRINVWYGLQIHTKQIMHRSKTILLGLDGDRETTRPSFSQNFLSDLSDTTKCVWQVIQTLPDELSQILRYQTPRARQRVLSAYLLGLGYSSNVIAQAFSELREALTNREELQGCGTEKQQS